MESLALPRYASTAKDGKGGAFPPPGCPSACLVDSHSAS